MTLTYFYVRSNVLCWYGKIIRKALKGWPILKKSSNLYEKTPEQKGNFVKETDLSDYIVV